MGFAKFQPLLDRGLGVLRRFSSLKLTLLFLWCFLVFLLVGVLFGHPSKSLFPLEKVSSPELVPFWRQIGLSDIFSSPWFTSFLFGLILNLLGIFLFRLPAIYRESQQKRLDLIEHFRNPDISEIEGDLSQLKDCYWMEYETDIAAPSFKKFVQRWTRSTLGKTQVLRTHGGPYEGQIHLAVIKNRYSILCAYLSFLFLFVALFGMGVSWVFGFEGRVSIPESQMTSQIKTIKGKLSPELEDIKIEGTRIHYSFFDTSTKKEIDRPLENLGTHLKFFDQKTLLQESTVEVNRPIKFKGHKFFQIGISEPGKRVADLIAGETKREVEFRFRNLSEGSKIQLDGALFEVLAIRTDLEKFGAAVQVRYHEKGSRPESFWLFENKPHLDYQSRSKSRYNFMLESLHPLKQSELLVFKDPGWPILATFGSLALVLFLISIFFPQSRYWFVWDEGFVKVVGWSSPLAVFRPTFRTLMKYFKAGLSKMDRDLKREELMISHGKFRPL